MTKMYSKPPELCSKCKKSMDTNSWGADMVMLCSDARVGKLGCRCLRHGHTFVTTRVSLNGDDSSFLLLKVISNHNQWHAPCHLVSDPVLLQVPVEMHQCIAQKVDWNQGIPESEDLQDGSTVLQALFDAALPKQLVVMMARSRDWESLSLAW